MGWFRDFLNGVLPKRTQRIDNSTKVINFTGLAGFNEISDPNKSAIYKNAVSTNAKHISKLKPKTFLKQDPSLNKAYLDSLLSLKPNPAMTAPQFWEVVATSYFAGNLALIYIEKDYISPTKPIKALWPLDIEGSAIKIATEKQTGRVAVGFNLNGVEHAVFLDEIIVLQRNASIDTLFSTNNDAINLTLTALQEAYKGIAYAVQASRFVKYLVSTSSLVSDQIASTRRAEYEKQIKASESGLVYVSNPNETFTRIEDTAKWPNAAEIQVLKEDIYSYFGITPGIIQGKFTEDEWQSYYETTIEPFVIKLLAELNAKLFTQRQIELGNEIKIDANPLQTISYASRIKLAEQLVKLPLVKTNQIMSLLYLDEIEGGDVPQVSLNYVKAGEQSSYQGTGTDPVPEEKIDDKPNAGTK